MSVMTVDDRRRRRAAVVLLGLLFGPLLLLVAPAAPASAHAALVASDPAGNAVVPEAPDRVTLTFSEPVQLVPDKIQVLAPDGARADQGQPTLSGATVTVSLRPGGARGTYLVSYRLISADSHPVSGSLLYSVGAPSAAPTAGDDTTGWAPAVKGPIPVAKYLGWVGLILIIGPVLVLALLWPHRLSRRRPAMLVWIGVGLVAVSTLAGLWLQAPYTLGVGVFDVGLGDLRDVLGTTFGAVMLVRLGVLCAAAVLLRPLLLGSGGESRVDLALLGVLGVAALGTWPLTGHPSASPVAGVSVIADAVHLAAVAVWLGGLIMLVAFLLPQANERELGAILPIWSRWAAAAVGALVLAGTTQALIEVGSFGRLLDTGYGKLLMVKVGLVVLVIAVAAYSRRLVQRRTPDSGLGGLRRTVFLELGITAVVLALTSALVQNAPARSAEAVQTGAVSTTVTRTLTAKGLSLQANVFPAAVGNNSVHLYAYGPDAKPLPVVEWVATAALPAKNIEPIEVPLLRITDNHVIGEIALPSAGDWVLRFTLRTSEIDQSTVSMTVTIA